jgi:aerobic carbon-monoxide dehydrogenase large subunit
MNDVVASEQVTADTPIVGQSTRRPAVDRFTRGRGVYIADIELRDMLYVALARSPIAHGRILKIDCDEARRCDGVIAVFTASDLTGVKAQPLLWDLPGQQYSQMRALAEERLRYVGQPYAAVVARTREQAERGAACITVRFELLPPILSIDASLAADAPRIYPDWKDNIVGTTTWRTGEPERALAESATVVSGRFISQRVHPLSLEPRGVLAHREGDGSLTLWTSTQSIHQVRSSIAECLDLPEHRIRVIAPDVGGAFGMKGSASVEETLVAFLAMKLDRPVRWIESRAEAFVGLHGRDERVDLDLGLDVDGRITALKARIVLDKGADPTACSFGTAWVTGAVITSGYRVPATDVEGLGALTNKSPTTAYRGYGQPEANLAIERALDIGAQRLGLSPAEIRRRNFVPAAEMPYVTPAGMALDSGEYERLMDMTLERFGYREALARAAASASGPIGTGVGFACYTELTNFGPSAVCKFVGVSNGGFDVCSVRMEPSGHVRLFISQTPMGQGIETALAQICAQELGLNVDDITVSHGDTLSAPYTAYASGGSRGAGVGGSAVVLATRSLAGQIRRWGAQLLGAPEANVVLTRGGVEVLKEPERRMAMAAVAAAAYFGAFCPEGATPGLEARAAYDPPALAISYGTVAVEVELDRETGRVAVRRLTFGHDCGTQINPAIVEGQVRGGAVQAIGATLFEELCYDGEGRPLVMSMHDYLVPLASDVPSIDLVHLTTPTPFSPLGVKGVGESGTIAVPAAIMNAVQHAIGPGVTLTELPLRAERVLKMVRAAAEVERARVTTAEII